MNVQTIDETRKLADIARDTNNIEEAIQLYLAASMQGDVNSFKSLLEVSNENDLGLAKSIVSKLAVIEEKDDATDKIPDLEELPFSEFADEALKNADGNTSDLAFGLVLEHCINNGFLSQLVEEMVVKLPVSEN